MYRTGPGTRLFFENTSSLHPFLDSTFEVTVIILSEGPSYILVTYSIAGGREAAVDAWMAARTVILCVAGGAATTVVKC